MSRIRVGSMSKDPSAPAAAAQHGQRRRHGAAASLPQAPGATRATEPSLDASSASLEALEWVLSEGGSRSGHGSQAAWRCCTMNVV